MGKDKVEQEQVEQTAEQMDDIEIAEEASRVIADKDKQISALKKQLAQQKLYRTVEDEVEETPTRDDFLKTLSASDTTNYDYAEAVIGLRELEISEGRPDPLGEDGEEVAKFLKSVLEDCNGNKTAFPSLYSARLGQDSPADAAAYRKATK